MEASGSTEAVVTIYETTGCKNPSPLPFPIIFCMLEFSLTADIGNTALFPRREDTQKMCLKRVLLKKLSKANFKL
jgi:hypothetical protein